ncbi:MAG: CBS domain-containing protein [Parvularculaceae bacterium]
MKIAEILRSKGATVHAVSADDKISEAVKLLNEHNIGAVVVKNANDEPLGILSERDVVRRLGKDGASVLSLPVKSCMTSDPVTCGIDAKVDEILACMTERRIRHIPVVNGDKLIGLISIGDVVKRKIEESEQEAAALREYITS